MKFLVSFVISLMFFSCLTEEDKSTQVIIKGKVFDTIMINLYEKPPLGEKRFVQYGLDASSKQETVFEIPDSLCNKRLYLSCNRMFSLIELDRGQKLTIHVDSSTMHFRGDKSKKNQYLYDWIQDYVIKFPNAYAYRLYKRNFLSRYQPFDPKEEDFDKTLNELQGLNERAWAQLEEYGVKDKEFIATQKVWIKYFETRILLENYAFMRSFKKPMSERFVKRLSEIELNDIDLMQHPDAKEVLSRFFLMQEELLGMKRVIPHQLAGRVKELKHIELQEMYLLEELEGLIRAQKGFLLDAIIENVTPFIKSAEGQEKFEKIKLKSQILVGKQMRGQDAFNFALKDAKGKVVKMSDFKGKYVFIDIWATWCGPCKANIPYVNMLEEELKGENIAFVSISIDKPQDKQKWMDFLKETHIGGTSLIAEAAFKSEICKFYKVNAIPRFILVDPAGKLVSAHCRQPMDAAFRAYLIDFIKKS